MEVVYIDHMGDDLRVVNAARVSFSKESAEFKDGDKRLLKYLASNGHWTPFAHPQISLREQVPVFVARQRFKHMVGFTYNEVSRRYVSDEPEFYIPKVWRAKPEGSIKQGSGYSFHKEDIEGMTERLSYIYQDIRDLYTDMIDGGFAPEMARMILPQSMYTEYYVTGSLAAWARAYKQRSDPHAQEEIRNLASKWDEVIRPLFPESWSALVD